MLNLILLLILSPYTAILLGVYALYKVYKDRNYYIIENCNTWNLCNMGLFALFVWSFMVGIVNKSLVSTLASLGFLLYFSLSILIQEKLSNNEIINKVFNYLLGFSVFAGIFGIVEKYLFSKFTLSLWRAYLGLPIEGELDYRISSTFVNSNVAGDWFAIMIIVAVFYSGICKTKKQKWIYNSMIVLFLIDLCLTGSRGAFIALIGGLAVLFLLKGSKKNIVAIGIVVAIISIVGFMPSEVSAISEEITGHEIARSFDTREEIWRGSIRMFEDKPITGWGMAGTIEQSSNYFRTGRIVNHSHNIWLSFATSLGFIGLILYLIMRLSVYRGIYYLYKENATLFPLLVAIQIALVCHGTIDFTIITPQIGILFIGSSSMILSLAKNEVNATFKERHMVNSIECRI